MIKVVGSEKCVLRFVVFKSVEIFHCYLFACLQANNVFNMQEWQEGLKALLPNINISFGPQRAGMAGYPMPPAPGATAEGSTSNGSVPPRVFQPHINDRSEFSRKEFQVVLSEN